MLRKSLISFLGLTASITLSLIPITARLDGAQQRGAEPKPSSAQRNQATPKPSAVVLPGDPSPYTGEETRKNNQTAVDIQRDVAFSSQRMAQDTKRIADYTLVLTFVGFGVGLFNFVLLAFQALYTGKAANAAAESSRIADIALKTVERAYIDVDKFKLCHPLDLAHAHRVVLFEIKNTGNTPARVIDTTFDWAIAPSDKPPTPTFDKDSHPSPYSLTNQSLPPIVERVLRNPAPTDEQVAQVIAGKEVLFIWGGVTYVDAFGRKHRRRYGAVYWGGNRKMFELPTEPGWNEDEQIDQDQPKKHSKYWSW